MNTSQQAITKAAHLKARWGNFMTFDPDIWQVMPRRFEYDIVAYRRPLKGEYFVSGAIPQAYMAHNDLAQEYWVVTRGRQAMRKTVEVVQS